MASESKPTILFIHGHYHRPLHYENFTSTLKKNGFEVVAPHLPSSNPDLLNAGTIENPIFENKPPKDGYPTNEQDANAITKDLEDLVVKQAKHVIVVVHSAAGASTGEAVKEELTRGWRKANGEEGGVIGMLYIAAFAVCKGESLAGTFGGYITSSGWEPDWFEIHKNGLLSVAKSEQLWNDSERSLSEATTKKFPHLLANSPSPRPLDNVPYKTTKLAYVRCEEDKAVPVGLQDQMIKATREKHGAEWKVYKLKTGHCPHLTRPKELVAVVEEWVGLCVAEA